MAGKPTTKELERRIRDLQKEVKNRREAEGKLRESEERLKSIVNGLPALIAYVDADQKYQFVNKEYENWFGLSQEEIVGKSVKEILGDAGYRKVKDKIGEVLSGRIVSYEDELPLGDGSFRDFRAHYVAHMKEDERIPGYFVLVEDITQRKRAEKLLTKEKDRAQKYLDIAGVILLVLNADQTVSLINRRGCEILGYEESEIAGKNWFDLFVPDKDTERTRFVFTKLMRGDGEPTEYHENPVLTRSGEERLVAWHNTLLRDEEGRITGTLSSGEDISERKRAEEALQRANDDLEERIKELNSLYGISKLVEKLGISLQEIIQGIVDLITSSWQYPEVTCARVILDGQEFKTENFRETIWRQTSEVVVHGNRAGVLEVFYLEEKPARDEGPFLEEERNLLDAIAERLGRIAERVKAGEALRRAHDELEDRVRERTAELSIANQNLQREISERQEAETALRRSEAALRHLSSRLLTAQEEERKRIALELHDSIAQRLAAIKFSLESKLGQMGESPPPPGISVEEIISMVQNGIEETRRIMTNLRPSMLDELGIISTIQWHLREFERVYGGITLRKKIDIQEEEFPDPLKIVIYRILQEATSNIARHSEADLISIDLCMKEKAIEMCFQDNGVGFEVEEVLSKVSPEKGLGLMGMKERTEYSGGSFSIESRKGEGTIIRATWQC